MEPVSQHGRRKAHGEHENEERWLVTYADMITLLMAFFIMMYAMSIVNLGKFNELAVSVRSGFGGTSPGLRSASTGFEARRGQVPLQLPLNAFDLMSDIARAVESDLSGQEMKDLDILFERVPVPELCEKRLKSPLCIVFEDSGDNFQRLDLEGISLRDKQADGHPLNRPVRNADGAAFRQETGGVTATGNDALLGDDTPFIKIAKDKGGHPVSRSKAEGDHRNPGDDPVGQFRLRSLFIPTASRDDRLQLLLINRFFHHHPNP